MKGSKTSKKNGSTCKYVYVKGKRDGEVCDQPCRGDYCKNHNKNHKKYMEKYIEKKKSRNSRDKYKMKINKLKKMQVNSKIKYNSVLNMSCSHRLTALKWNDEANILISKYKVIEYILNGFIGVDDIDYHKKHSGKIMDIYDKCFTMKKEEEKKNENNDDYEGFKVPGFIKKKLNDQKIKLGKRKEFIIKKLKQYKEYNKIIDEKIHTYLSAKKEKK